MVYDLVIIGGSAAGTAAGVYAARRGLKFVVIAKDLGGEVVLSGDIENWPGIIHTNGLELSSKFSEHLRSYQPEIVEGSLVQTVESRDGMFAVTTDAGTVYEAKSVIVCSGAHSRELGVPGEREYRLKGVSYCTVCDGPVFGGKVTAVIGGGNSALEAALMLADLCPKVYVINKNAQFKGEQVLIDNLAKRSNVEIITQAMTTEITGDGKFATGLKYTDAAGTEHPIEAAGMFVHIGQVPNSAMVPAGVTKDPYGYIVVGSDAASSLAGLFAAGDVTNTPHKQIVIAAGMGATAALSAVQYINRLSA